jgi:predicted small metal-binding protein
MEFFEFLNQCGTITMGKEYEMEELLEAIKEIIEHKRTEHNMNDEMITLEFSFFLNTPIEELNTNDTNTFIYPLLFHLLTKSYEDLWMDKHKSAWPTTYALKRSYTQTLISIKYPPCPLKDIDATEFTLNTSPIYSELPDENEKEDNEQSTILPMNTMQTIPTITLTVDTMKTMPTASTITDPE